MLMYTPYTIPLMTRSFPSEIPAFIEVSSGSRNKYEYNNQTGLMMLDRVLHSAVYYPYDYGFIPQTLCKDGDPLDVLVIGTSPLIPGCVAMIRPICYMVMEDEKGQDEKVLAVLSQDPAYQDVKTMSDISKHKLLEITQFFETYKALEKDKWVRVGEWKDVDETNQLIVSTHQHYLDNLSL